MLAFGSRFENAHVEATLNRPFPALASCFPSWTTTTPTQSAASESHLRASSFFPRIVTEKKAAVSSFRL